MPEVGAPVAGTFYTIEDDGLEESLARVEARLAAADLRARVMLDPDMTEFEAETAGLRVNVAVEFDRAQIEAAFRAATAGLRLEAGIADGLRNRGGGVDPNDPIAQRLAQIREASRLMRVMKDDEKKLSPLLGSGLRPQRGALGRAGNAISSGTDLSVDADTSPARRKIAQIKLEIGHTREDIAAGLNTREANAKLFEFQRRLRMLSLFSPDVRVRLEATEALAQMREVTARMRLMGSRPIVITVWIRDNLDKLNAKLAAFRALQDRLTPGLSRMQRIILLVTAALGPLTIALGGTINALGGLVVGVGQAVGSLGAIPGVIGAAIGVFSVLKLGLGGVGTALSALKKGNENALQSTTALRDAEESLSDALWALDQQRVTGTRNVISAENAHTAALRAQRNSVLQTKLAAIQYRESIESISDALEDLEGNLDRSNLSVEQAERAYREALLQGDDLAAQQAKLDWQDAVKNQKRTARDNGEMVSDAPTNAEAATSAYADALQAEVDAAQAVEDAEDALADARAQNSHDAMLAQRAVRDATEERNKADQEAIGVTSEAQAALAALGEEARQLIGTILAIGPAWHQVKLAVQDALLDGMAESIQDLSDTYLPILRDGLVDVAGELNGVGQELIDFLNTGEGQQLVADILSNVADSLEAMQPLVEPMTHALLTLIEGSSDVLPELIDRLTEVVTTFDTFITEASQDGSLQKWIKDGVTALGDLLDLGWQLLTLIGNLAGSMNQMGSSPLQVMADSLRTLNDSIAEGTPGREALDAFFANIGEASREVFTPQFWDTVLSILSSFSENLVTMAPHLSTFLQNFGDLMLKVSEGGSMTTILDALFDVFSELFSVMAEPEFQDALKQIATSIADLLTEMIESGTIESFVQAIAALAPVMIDAYVQAAEFFLPALKDLFDFIAEHPDLVASVTIGIQALAAALPFVISLAGAIVALFGTGAGEAALIAAGIAAVAAAAVALWGAVSNVDWSELWDTVWGGIKSGYDTLVGWLSWDSAGEALAQFFIDAVAWIKDFLGIASPSKVLADIGHWMIEGLFQGLQEIWSKLTGWTNQLTGWIRGLGSSIASAATGMWDGMKEAFRSVLNWIIDKWNGLDLKFTVPDSILGVPIPVIGGKEVGLETPDLPRYEKGGTSIGEQLAWVSDNPSGLELHKPLDTRGMAQSDYVLLDSIEDLKRLIAMMGTGAQVNVELSAEFAELTGALTLLMELVSTPKLKELLARANQVGGLTSSERGQLVALTK